MRNHAACLRDYLLEGVRDAVGERYATLFLKGTKGANCSHGRTDGKSYLENLLRA